MKQSSMAAIGGIVSSLAVVIMLCTYISPLLVYTAPPFAGLLLVLTVNELGYKWSLGTYATISILSLLFIADKEAAVFFTMFFGYFPILVLFFEEKLNNMILKFIIKLLIFDLSCSGAVFISSFVFGIDYSDFLEDGILFLAFFIIMMNVLFVIYDRLVIRLQQLYKLKIQKRFRKLFGIR